MQTGWAEEKENRSAFANATKEDLLCHLSSAMCRLVGWLEFDKLGCRLCLKLRLLPGIHFVYVLSAIDIDKKIRGTLLQKRRYRQFWLLMRGALFGGLLTVLSIWDTDGTWKSPKKSHFCIESDLSQIRVTLASLLLPMGLLGLSCAITSWYVCVAVRLWHLSSRCVYGKTMASKTCHWHTTTRCWMALPMVQLYQSMKIDRYRAPQHFLNEIPNLLSEIFPHFFIIFGNVMSIWIWSNFLTFF